MRISKSLAESVAKKLVADKEEYIDLLIAEKNEVVEKSYRATIPADVLKASKKHGSFFRMSKGINFSGEGLSYSHASFSEPLPTYNSTFVLEGNDANTVQNLQSRIFKRKDELKVLRQSIETALIQLATFNRIKEIFPEAAKFLPEGASSAVSVNLSGIRKQLKGGLTNA